jgi:hypothetical protein
MARIVRYRVCLVREDASAVVRIRVVAVECVQIWEAIRETADPVDRVAGLARLVAMSYAWIFRSKR